MCVNSILSNVYFINPGKTLASWVLALEQELYLPYTKKGDKEDNTNYRPILTHL